MYSPNQSSPNDNHSRFEDSPVEQNPSSFLINNQIIGVNVSDGSTFIVERDLNITISAPLVTKDDYWKILISGSGKEQVDAAFRLIDLSCNDPELAEKF